MSQKTVKVIGWVCTGLLAFIFVGSAIAKLTASPEMLQQSASWGLTPSIVTFLGVLEIVCFILFAIPRTGILGTLLLAAYMGGAIATHLEHQQSVVAPVIISAFLWITALVRFPELLSRLLRTLGKESQA
jgi:hypothetical protein